MSDSPSQAVVSASAATKVVTDAKGRVITARRINALDRYRLFKAIGPDQAMNAPLFGMATLAACVVDIDGVPQPFPATDHLIQSILARLGDEGVNAVAGAFADDVAAEG